jgi:hypothetical protein
MSIPERETDMLWVRRSVPVIETGRQPVSGRAGVGPHWPDSWSTSALVELPRRR